jgi:hypothetical protein
MQPARALPHHKDLPDIVAVFHAGVYAEHGALGGRVKNFVIARCNVK